MSQLMEWQGTWYRMQYGDGCEDCGGTGAGFVHTETCRDDLCVGNGDEHSCLGDWLPCSGCGSMEPYTAIRPPACRSCAGE